MTELTPLRYELELVFKDRFDPDPPSVFISEVILARDGRERLGGQVIEVFEDPMLKADVWSKNDEDWEVGPIAKKVLHALNSELLAQK